MITTSIFIIGLVIHALFVSMSNNTSEIEERLDRIEKILREDPTGRKLEEIKKEVRKNRFT